MSKAKKSILPKECTSLEGAVHGYEAGLIRRALAASGGSLTRAALALGVSYQGLAYILKTRHRALLPLRTKIITRPPRIRRLDERAAKLSQHERLKLLLEKAG